MRGVRAVRAPPAVRGVRVIRAPRAVREYQPYERHRPYGEYRTYERHRPYQRHRPYGVVRVPSRQFARWTTASQSSTRADFAYPSGSGARVARASSA